jgi:hypothetical protein
MEAIVLDDYESQLVYLSKGWFEYNDIYQALIKLREKYYLIHEPQENRGSYIRVLSDIAYYSLFHLCMGKLYSMTFSKECFQREFLDEIMGNKLWMASDWKDGQIETLLDYKEFTVKNILNKLISILSTLQIYEHEHPTDFKNPGKMYELIHLQPIDSSILPVKNKYFKGN